MKNKLFLGLMLVSTSFLVAAFIKSDSTTNSYIQKPNNCEAIPMVDCSPSGNVQCMWNDGTGTYPVYMARTNVAQCNTPLFTRE